MTTLIALTRMMERYNHIVAPENECGAWRQFIEECGSDLHRTPWGEKADNVVPEGFAQYWRLVAAGESRDFDALSGEFLSRA